MARLANLDEKELSVEMIDDRLIAMFIPPFVGEIVFPACGDEPIWNVLAGKLGHRPGPRSLFVTEVNVSFESRRPDGGSKFTIDVVYEAEKAMKRRLVALVDGRELALDDLNIRAILPEWGQVGVVFPDCRKGRADIGDKLFGMAEVQVTYDRCQENNISDGVGALDDDFPPAAHRPRSACALTSGTYHSV